MSNPIRIERTYGNPEAAIIRPEHQVPVTAYNIDRWLPRLGVQRWALVQVLRRLALDAPLAADGTRRLEITRDDLAQRLGIWVGTIGDWLRSEPIPGQQGWRRLAGQDEATQALARFIPRLRYTYTRSEDGKTRRTGLALYIRMDEPLTPEDEARLPEVATALIQSQMTQTRLETAEERPEGVKSEITISPGSVKSENPISHSSVKSEIPISHDSVKSENPISRGGVKSENPTSRPPVKSENPISRGVKSENPTTTLTLTNERYIHLKIKRLISELDLTLTDGRRIRGRLTSIVRATEEALEDYHSTQMLYKVLLALYRVRRLDLFLQAVETAVETGALDAAANRGAVFVSEIKRLGREEGVNVGLAGAGRPVVREAEGGGEAAPPVSSPEPPARLPLPDFPIPGGPNSSELWETALRDLSLQMSKATFDTWLRGTWIVGYEPPADGVEPDRFVIRVKSEYAVGWLSHRLAPVVVRTLERLVGRPVQVEFAAAPEATG